MTTDRTASGYADPAGSEEDPELADLFAKYVERLNRGERLHPQEILAKHPEVGERLLSYLDGFIETDPDWTKPRQPTLGDYTLNDPIGRGGMGVVYDAWQNSLDRQVALKVLPVGVAVDDRAFHRFMREAKTAAKLNHQNIVRVYGMGVEASTPYYAMERVNGKTLAQIVASWSLAPGDAGPAPFGSENLEHAGVARAFAGVADGLHHAHANGVIHRDIKPSNLIFDHEGRLRILDFGLAQLEGQEALTLTGDVIGTPLYMSPEQAQRRKTPVDHRTDIYSLGATLYEVLTRRPPFRGKDHQETLSQIIAQDASSTRRIDPTVPKDLDTIVMKCLRKNPKDRYDTAAAVAEDLRRFSRGEPIEAQPLPPWEGARQWVSTYGLRLGIACVFAFLLIFYSVVLLFQPKEVIARRVLSAHDMDLNNFWDLRPSPDGRRLAYSAQGSDGALCVRDLATGETVPLTRGVMTFSGDHGPVWSPDAKQIAYRIHPSGVLKIVDVAARRSFVPEGIRGLALWPLDWSPDGTMLICRQKRGATESMISVSLAAGTVTTLVADSLDRRSSAVFSRDGRYIAYSAVENDNQDIFIIASDGTRKRRVTHDPGRDSSPLWSPSGDTLVYAAANGLWAIPIADGKAAGSPRFLRSEGLGRALEWTAEAGLFFQKNDFAHTFYALELDPRSGIATSPPRLILDMPLTDGHKCSWSPDMKKIAFCTYDDKVFVYSTGNRSVQSFSITTEGPLSKLWWSQDGNRILYIPRLSQGRRIDALDIASGEVEPLFAPLKGERFDLRPGGREMLFYRWNGHRDNGRRELVISEIGRREGRVLVTEEDNTIGQLSHWVFPAFSPDGHHILFGTTAGDLWVAAADGSEMRKVVASADRVPTDRFDLHHAAWHPDGRHIIYDNWRTFFLVNLDTGQKQRVFIPKNTFQGVAVLEWSPDGQQIAFRGERGSGPELWSIQNLLAKVSRDE